MSKFQRSSSLFVVGVKDFRWTPELASFLKSFPVSGLAMFNSPFDSPDNIWADKAAALEAVHHFMSKASENVRFVAADQEGGRVRRLRGNFVPLPSAHIMAENSRRDLSRVRRIYEVAAIQMKLSNVRVNFAPVCDIRYPDSNIVVGDRSFGAADDVRRMAKLFCQAFENNGVHTTLKHFPGHGPSKLDSHERKAVLFKSKRELMKEDTILFSQLAEDASAIMTAHIGFEGEEGLPFSINANLFNDFKDHLPPNKILFTDDVQSMKAVADLKPWVEAMKLPYDFVLLCGTLDQAASSIEEAIRFWEDSSTSFSKEQEWEKKVKKSESHFVSTEKLLPFQDWKLRMMDLEREGLDLIQGLSSVNQS